MPPEAAQKVEALSAQAQRLMAHVHARAGYEQIAPAIIQPAGLFLDVVGEELRARTYVFTDPDGEELCLRPDLTVPTCRLHLARYPAGDTPGALLLQRRRLPLSAGRRHQRASERVPPGRHRVVRGGRSRSRRCGRARPHRRGAARSRPRRASSCASATSACSRRCSTRCRCRSAGAVGCGIISGAPRRSAPSWRASPRATPCARMGFRAS